MKKITCYIHISSPNTDCKLFLLWRRSLVTYIYHHLIQTVNFLFWRRSLVTYIYHHLIQTVNFLFWRRSLVTYIYHHLIQTVNFLFWRRSLVTYIYHHLIQTVNFFTLKKITCYIHISSRNTDCRLFINIVQHIVVVVILFPTEHKQWRTEYMSNLITIRKP